MIIQYFLFMSHCSLAHFYVIFGFHVPKPEFIPQPTGVLPSLGQPNDTSSLIVLKLILRHVSLLVYELRLLPNLRAQGGRGSL